MMLSDASKYLNVSKSTLYKYCHLGKLKYYKPNNKLNYFLKDDLDDFIKGNNQKEVSYGTN